MVAYFVFLILISKHRSIRHRQRYDLITGEVVQSLNTESKESQRHWAPRQNNCSPFTYLWNIAVLILYTLLWKTCTKKCNLPFPSTTYYLIIMLWKHSGFRGNQNVYLRPSAGLSLLTKYSQEKDIKWDKSLLSSLQRRRSSLTRSPSPSLPLSHEDLSQYKLCKPRQRWLQINKYETNACIVNPLVYPALM